MAVVGDQDLEIGIVGALQHAAHARGEQRDAVAGRDDDADERFRVGNGARRDERFRIRVVRASEEALRLQAVWRVSSVDVALLPAASIAIARRS